MDIKWIESAFQRFQETWRVADFGLRGSSYHAFLRFARTAEENWPSDPTVGQLATLRSQMVSCNTEHFLKVYQGEEVCADDFGWWGLAFLAARVHFTGLEKPAEAARQLNLARACWAQLVRRGYDQSPCARPVPHGCANSPQAEPTGTKNTATNAGLLLLSLRLYCALRESDPGAAKPYLIMANAQLAWFDSWFTRGESYLKRVSPKLGLVQERPVSEPHYGSRDRPNWQQGFTWSGDQGLLIVALAELHALRNELAALPDTTPVERIVSTFETLTWGARRLLFGRDHVLREAPFRASFHVEPSDYVCGRGVFLRCVSEPAVQRMLGTAFFPAGVHSTADALWNSRNPTNGQFAADWTPGNNEPFNRQFQESYGCGDVEVAWHGTPGGDGALQTLGLDVLTAAMLT